MERFFKRKLTHESGSGSSSGNSSSIPKEVDLNNLPSDPAERKKISEYHPNQIDEIRRAYLIKGPCQPRGHDFPKKVIANKQRRFNSVWFDQYENWLEYSIKEDKAYCLCCYLFRDHFGKQGGSEAFVTEGFSSWNKTERLAAHVGVVNSAHHISLKKCEDLMRQEQSIATAFRKQSEILRNEYRIRLNTSIDACRFLLRQGLPFRGHDESEDSTNRGNFIELIKYTADQNETISNVVLRNAPQNQQMVAPKIQKDIVHCFAHQVVQIIIQELRDDFFAVLVDESSDVSGKEQMAIVLRFVDEHGLVKERFIGVVHVMETSALSLKVAIDSLFADHGLSLMKVRGQGYDGASNMKGEFNGLKSLILNENESAYYVHCFAHQLQLALVAVARKHVDIADFFNMISTLLNVVGASCKRRDMIRQSQAEQIAQKFSDGEIETGKGLNQELSLKRAGDTRWGSHYKSLLNLVALFSSVIEVLEIVSCDATDSTKKAQARGLLRYLQSFDFVFNLQLMLTMLEITNELSLALQRKDEDILNAIALVKVAKERLQNVRDEGWESLLDLRTDERFSQLKGLGDLSRLLVSTRKHISYPLVYRLLRLALVLPIATASVERCFSGMNIIKTDLRNRISDQFMNDCLVSYIEKELLGTITNDVVISHFQNMKTRREQL
ncbi:zinc finger MYM-type protein 1-like isoform X2 [Tripterygium wilfordii]|uniref:zinc finger MYM-type protein 1-like isoform X2 n=1 Tax=Tripterygium wilfordii TaxID=458696 RepID=UPI0018F84A3E|nr:zinc finger MYM-type protein 1-like isoform X2 [Tripterygium wilfordii]